MRIIAGEYKGKRLAKAFGDVRPPTDRARESLFNVMADLVVDAVWVEPFAGSGAVGIEALSRGARHVILNDKNPKALKLIKDNLARCGVERGYELYGKDALTLLNELKGLKADIVFLDPPYRFRRYDKLLKKVVETVATLDSVLVILEVFKKAPLDFIQPPWRLVRTLKIGDSHLLFLRSK